MSQKDRTLSKTGSQAEQLAQARADLRETQKALKAQRKLAGLGHITAGVAHEIKNPLNLIRNYAEAIADAASDLCPPEGTDPTTLTEEQLNALDIAEAASKISFHCERADRIVTDMLRIGNSTPQEFLRTDLNQLVTQYANLAYQAQRNALEGFNTHLIWELDPSNPTVEAKSSDLARLLINIVTNACHAVHQRRTQSAGHSPAITLATESRDGHVLVQVTDNGTGMDQPTLDNLFTPFFTTKEEGQGTGLGMSISQEIAQDHSGSISARSQPGQGTTITISLPREQPPPTAPHNTCHSGEANCP